jgi:CheY-like chemotaxis protein
LINLIANAVKFTEKGEVRVCVTSKVLEGKRYGFHFEVRDTGIGIPKDRMNKLFKSFSQVDMSTTRRYGGTGLGLAISKRLIEIMGGRIWAESKPGRGSTFHFTLQANASSDRLPLRISASLPKSCSHAGMRILMAEDNAVNQKVILKMLCRLGYRADVAADGIEVLKMLELQTYDLVLMDIQMPEMDGFEATREIRRRWPLGPKIVALTAYALEGDRERCIQAGMDGYIAKPVKMDDLKAALLHCEMQTARPV